jgi:putative tricarboxylic transport membrane protein
VRMLKIPYSILYPAILLFICIGVFSVNNSYFDVVTVMLFGLLGYVMMLLGFEPAPLVLGYILGPLMEEHLRRAMLLSRGSFMVFIERPISASLLAVTALLLVWAFWAALRGSGGAAERLLAAGVVGDTAKTP